MKALQKHIIRNVSVEYHYDSSADPFDLRQEADDWSRRQLQETLEEVLRSFDDYEEHICIDKLSININTEAEGWQREATDMFRHELFKQVRSYASKDSNISGQKIISQQDFTADLLIHFFLHGSFPWWSSIVSTNDFTDAVTQMLSAPLQQSTIEKLMHSFEYVISRERAANVLGAKLLGELLFIILPDKKQKLQQFQVDCEVLMDHVKEEGKSYFQKIVKTAMMNSAFDTGIVADLFRESIERGLLPIQMLQSATVSSPEIRQAITFLGNLSAESELSKDDIKALHPVGSQELYDHHREDEIYIPNAGLVILAPFLSTLFSRLGLLDDVIITNRAFAVCLTQYLVTGNDKMEEFELVLPKILCGLEPEELIDTAIIPTAAHKKEADELLQSVIEYWSILKNTSAEGFRDSFLQRKGKLSFNNNKWWLQVEQRSYDMLLRQLPWTIHMIRLPWIKHMIETEWVY